MDSSNIDPALLGHHHQRSDRSTNRQIASKDGATNTHNISQQSTSKQTKASINPPNLNPSSVNATQPKTRQAKNKPCMLTSLEAFTILARSLALIERLTPDVRERIAYYALKMDKRPVVFGHPFGKTPALHWFHMQQFRRQVITLVLASPMFLVDMKTILKRLGRIIVGSSRKTFFDHEINMIPNPIAAIGHPAMVKDGRVHLKIVIKGCLKMLRDLEKQVKRINAKWVEHRGVMVAHYRNKQAEQRKRESEQSKENALVEKLLREVMYVDGDVVVPKDIVHAEGTAESGAMR